MQVFKIKLASLAAMLVLGTQANIGMAAEDAQYWLNDGANEINNSKKLVPNARKAKNVILFVGDGMGISTVTGARIFEGQLKGIDGERNKLSFENFPYVALSKTYSTNQQTAD